MAAAAAAGTTSAAKSRGGWKPSSRPSQRVASAQSVARDGQVAQSRSSRAIHSAPPRHAMSKCHLPSPTRSYSSTKRFSRTFTRRLSRRRRSGEWGVRWEVGIGEAPQGSRKDGPSTALAAEAIMESTSQQRPPQQSHGMMRRAVRPSSRALVRSMGSLTRPSLDTWGKIPSPGVLTAQHLDRAAAHPPPVPLGCLTRRFACSPPYRSPSHPPRPPAAASSSGTHGTEATPSCERASPRAPPA